MIDKQQEILDKHQITIQSYKDNSIKDIPALLNKINKITQQKDDSIIQLINTDNICGKKHLKQAITQAFKVFDEKQNFANDPGLEIVVRLSAQKQINKALKKLGIKEKGNITIIYIDTTQDQIQETQKLFINRCDELLEEYDVDMIKKEYDIYSDENITEQINEQIALLALKG